VNRALLIQVTKVYEVVQFKPKHIYESFAQMIITKRNEALTDITKKTEAAMLKLAGNAAYDKLELTGFENQMLTFLRKTLEKRCDFTRTVFCEQRKAEQMLRSKLFLDLDEIESNCFELTSLKRCYTEITPKLVGVWILGRVKTAYDSKSMTFPGSGLAKLSMLKAYTEYLDHYFPRSNFELMEMDTDSMVSQREDRTTITDD
jgi:hypothetical protein